MIFSLNSNNVVNYLTEFGVIDHQLIHQAKIEYLEAKNFNLLLTLADAQMLLVKQERLDESGKTVGEFINEWQTSCLWKSFDEIKHFQDITPDIKYFDKLNSIIVFKYFSEYDDLSSFYNHKNSFPLELSSLLGHSLAHIHRSTTNRDDYRRFLQDPQSERFIQPSIGLTKLNRIDPEIFGIVPFEGLKFLSLYQRYDSLGNAISELESSVQDICLTHCDLKLNNILVHKDWQTLSLWQQPSPIRIIDWERSSWGDPAFDLGTLIASYLQIWLGSLVINSAVDLHESLRLAATPLEILQPSLRALMEAYLQKFPEILQHQPNFLHRVVQFSGLALVQQIQAMIQYQKSFGNAGICALQVAKSLLCRPQESFSTIFGVDLAQLVSFKLVNV
jgi:thiamine kinase-like enzyme